MKRKLLSTIIAVSAASHAVANVASGSIVAVISNKSPNNYIVSPNSGGGSVTPSDPKAIKVLECHWGACVGAYYSGQAFEVNGSTFTDITGFTNTDNVFISPENQLFIEDSGIWYGRGDNEKGMLGINDTDFGSKSNYTALSGLSGTVKKVISEDGKTFVLTSTGIYFAGSNELDNSVKIVPTEALNASLSRFYPVVSSSSIQDISLKGESFSYVDGGKLYVLGHNNETLFGTGSVNDGQVYSSFFEVPSLTNVSEVFIGGYDSLASSFILKEGKIWVSGNSKFLLGVNLPTKMGEFEDTGFAVSELNLHLDEQLLVIKNNQLYASFSNPFKLPGPGNDMYTGITLIEETKDISVKSFIKPTGDYKTQILTTDGKILKINHAEPDGYEIVDAPDFSG